MTATASFTIDTAEMRKLIYYKWGEKASAAFGTEMTKSFEEAGQYARTAGNKRINRWHGILQDFVFVKTRALAFAIESEVTWSATYAQWVNSGHGVIRPVTAKYLRWVDRQGIVHYAKSVRATYPGQQFAEKGLKDAEPQIYGAIQAGAARFADRVSP